MYGVCEAMIKAGGDLLHSCLLELFDCIHFTHFLGCLPVAVITAEFKAGDKQDMGNYRGTALCKTVCYKLSAG